MRCVVNILRESVLAPCGLHRLLQDNCVGYNAATNIQSPCLLSACCCVTGWTGLVTSPRGLRYAAALDGVASTRVEGCFSRCDSPVAGQ
jgi:hypothetical protein